MHLGYKNPEHIYNIKKINIERVDSFLVMINNKYHF